MKSKRVRCENVGIMKKYPIFKQETTTGITLIALVVTIVVLLILAGITIMYVMGDNGVFKELQMQN